MNTASNNENQQAHGAELRRAREQAGMTLEQASSDSRMPVRVLVALEAGEWTKLGAPVFVRGQLRSYAKLLGINADAFLADAEIAPVRPVELVSHDHTPRGERFFNQLGSKVVYAVMTAALAIPVYMVATRSPVPAQQQAEASQQAGRGTELMPPPREPVAASMASLPKPAEAVTLLAKATDAGSLEVLGDAQAKLAKPAEAQKAYRDALRTIEEGSPRRQVVQLKLAEVGG